MNAPPYIEAASTLAVVASSPEPLLFLNAQLSVIAASASFCRRFNIEPNGIAGRPLDMIGQGEWATAKVRSLLQATLVGAQGIEEYEFDLVRVGEEDRIVVLSAHKLADEEGVPARLLLAMRDVTDARAEARERDELIRQNAVLLKEIQHRVANSLQIIASLLMQSARKVQSDEARGHLQNAHHRVMSIAAVQRHLSQSVSAQVPLRPYFVQLCESLSASMIADRENFSLKVAVDESIVDANQSVSLGLIITELVINALKHAFVDRDRGSIEVAYSSDGDDWTLVVGDDGIGMPEDAAMAKPGLGTGIVEALANKLGGVITVSDNAPGTLISIVHVHRDHAGEPLPRAA